MSDSLDATYRACLVLTRWLNLLLPLAIVAMLASQASTISVGSLLLMSKFLLVLCGSAVILVTGSLILIAAVTRRGLREVLRAHQDVLLMAVTTRSTVACIPSLIDILSHQLRLHRGLIEVMVPLLMMVLRVGAIMMYVVGVVFIAQLHDRVLGLDSLLLVGCASVMVAMTTIGSSGIGVVWQMAIICGYLALPFEAAFPLFVAVETVSDTLRTVVVVASVSGVTAAIAPAEVAGQGDLQTVAAGVTQVG
jgi:Na+/H+-dicarboxylate symporter